MPLLSEGGHLYLEKNANNPAQIAAITSLDAFGNPSSYGPLFSIGTGQIQDATINGASNTFGWSFLFDQAPAGINYTVGANPTRTRDSNEQIGGAVITFADLGLTTGQTYFGVSYFDASIFQAAVNSGAVNLVSLAGVDITTVGGVGQAGGADFGGGLGGFLLTANAAADLAAIQLFKTISAVTIAAGANPAIADAGDTITYAFTVTNTGSTR